MPDKTITCQQRNTIITQMIDRLVENLFGRYDDVAVVSPVTLVALVLAHEVVLYDAPTLDSDQHLALNGVTVKLDKAREKRGIVGKAPRGSLSQQHRASLGDAASLSIICDMLFEAFAQAAEAGIELRVTTSRRDSIEGSQIWRAGLKAIGLKAAAQDKAA